MKPVRKTKAEIDALVAKAVVKQVVHEQHIRSGTLTEIKQAFEDFAKKHNVKIDEVRLVQGSWSKASLKTKADETPVQVRWRVEYNEDRKYRNALYKYQDWKSVQDQQARRDAALSRVRYTNTTNIACCPVNCCCRR